MINIINLLEESGPLTGKEMVELTNISAFRLWKICSNNAGVLFRTVGKKYLRLDKNVQGWARFSPSIIREFYSYTVIGLEKQLSAIQAKADRLQQEVSAISQKKYQLAQAIMKQTVNSQPDSELILKHACFMIAGDVAYEMAHLEPRPEFSTGELVNGSDLDIVVVTDGLPENITKALDAAIFDQKAYLLRSPSYREEIDYVVKSISIIGDQLKFDCFKSMVASKVLYEGKFLYGNLELFNEVKKMIAQEEIPQKIAELEEKATVYRNNARLQLLSGEMTIGNEDTMALFCSKEEYEEFF